MECIIYFIENLSWKLNINLLMQLKWKFEHLKINPLYYKYSEELD